MSTNFGFLYMSFIAWENLLDFKRNVNLLIPSQGDLYCLKLAAIPAALIAILILTDVVADQQVVAQVWCCRIYYHLRSKRRGS